MSPPQGRKLNDHPFIPPPMKGPTTTATAPSKRDLPRPMRYTIESLMSVALVLSGMALAFAIAGPDETSIERLCLASAPSAAACQRF